MAGGPRSRSVVRLPAARQALDFVRVSDTAEHWHGQSHPDRHRTARGALALAAVAMLACAADAPQPVARVDGEDIRWFAWTNDDRLVFTTIGLQAGLRGSASADCTR